MAASGVSVNPECKEVYEEIKMKKKHRYVVYALTKNLAEIHIEKIAPPEATYDEFVEDLKAAEDQQQCRYAVYDVAYNKDGVKRDKLVFFFWSPECAKIKQKMVYSASLQALKSKLVDTMAIEVQANDHGDLQWEEIVERIKTCVRD